MVGESLAVQIGRRLGFAEPDVAVLGAVVRHHLLLPHTATRRDLEDQATVVRVVETLEQAVPGAGALLLDLLGALAEADSLATGPGVWSPWKRVLIGDLVARCRALLAGEALPAPTAPSTAEIAMAAAVAAEGRPQLRLEPGDPATVTVALPKHRTGGLAAAAGVLALHSLVVHAAAVLSADVACPAVTVFRFTVTPRFGGFPDPALLRSNLARVLDGSLALDEALARKERDYAPAASPGEPPAPARVLWFDDEATGAVVMELRGTDRIGLLHRVAAALAQCDVGPALGAGLDARRVGGGRVLPRHRRRHGRAPAAARWSRRCSPRRGSPTGTERANRTFRGVRPCSPRAARPDPAARGGHARRGQVHAARPPARAARCRGPRLRRPAGRAAGRCSGPCPTGSYRPLVHAWHRLAVLVAAFSAVPTVVVHLPATGARTRAAVALLARMSGRAAYLLWLHVDPADARAGQRDRGRVVGDASFSGHAGRALATTDALRDGPPPGFAEVTVLDRRAAARGRVPHHRRS